MKALLTAATFLALALSQLQPPCNQGLPYLTPYLTPHFQNWLNQNGYSSFNFVRSDLSGGSYGGKQNDSDVPVNRPVIFFHGNSDMAIGNGTASASWQTGFRDAIEYFISQGYKESELYITTWGPANPNEAQTEYHSYYYVNYLRNFFEAVINYTNATSVDVVAHSMGVTLARKVIKGGSMKDNGTEYQVGPSLAGFVDSFIALAGANWGLQVCEFEFQYPTCGMTDGFFPGVMKGASGTPVEVSKYLADVNNNGGQEAEFIATLWAYPFDSVIGMQTFFGHNTSEITYQDATEVYPGAQWTHFDLRDATCPTVLQAIRTHTLSKAQLNQ